MADIKISELPQADLPDGTEFSEIVQDGANKRIDDNDRISGKLEPKPNVFVDAYNPLMTWECDLKVTPFLNGTWMPGYFCKLNRVGDYNPYDEERYYTYSSFGSVGTGFVSSISGGTYSSYDTGLNNRGMTTTIAKRINSDPFSPWDSNDKSAAIFLDCATSLPANPTLAYENTKIIFPFRGDADYHVALIQPLILTSASGATLTPARLTEIAEFTGLTTNATIAAPSGAAINGKPLVIRILASGADRTLTWNAYYRPIGVSLPTTAPNGKWVYVMGYFNTASAKVDVVDVKVQA